MNKIKTTIQYRYTNIKLFNDIFYNFTKFNNELKKGPENMKKYFFENWKQLRNETNDNLEIMDLEKEVTLDEFDISLIKNQNGTLIFIFLFPEPIYFDASSKYVALALTKELPRYFTLEISKNYITNTKNWVVGEFYFDKNSKMKFHRNYGYIGDDNLKKFSDKIINILKNVEQ